MKLMFRVAGVIAATVAGMGCGSNAPSTSKPPVDAFDAGPGPDLSTTSPDASVDDAMPPAAMVGAGSVRLFSGSVRFLSSGVPCSNDTDPKADLWCAFLTPSPESPGADALYAVNITRALAGATLSCDSPIGDPNCLLLTRGFAENTTHRGSFQGSTLLYYDSTGVGYGWRPGMVNGRRLTAGEDDVHDCIAGKTGDAVACLRDLQIPVIPGTVVATNAVFSELVAGRLGPDSPPLPVVDTVISSDPAEDITHFQFRIVGALSNFIAWSTPLAPKGPETLKLQTIGDSASQRVIASEVSRWLVPPDGLHWTWLKDFNYDSNAPSGTLQIAPFPDGTAPTTLVPTASNFWLAGNNALAVMKEDGDLVGIPDPVAAPTDLKILDSEVIGVIGSSAVGHLAYAKKFDFVFGLIDLHVQKVDGTGAACFLDFREEVPYGAPLTPRFLSGGRDIIWSQVTNLDDPFGELKVSGRVTRLSDCTTQNVHDDIGAISPLGDEGITFSDTLDNGTATLKIRRVLADGTLAPDATVIQTRASASLSLYPFARAVVYSVNIGDPADGLYIHPVVFPAD